MTNSFFQKNQNLSKKQLIIITGATGSGKSKYAIELAKRINGVIINCDCMQIYKQIPIITAQPTIQEQSDVKHFLYGFYNINNYHEHCYSVGEYILDLKNILKKIEKEMNDKIPIIVGGTMLYITAIINGISKIPDIKEDIRKNIELKYQNLKIEELYSQLEKIDKKYAKVVDKNNPHRILRGIEVKLSTGKSIIDFWEEKTNTDNYFYKNYEIKKYIMCLDRNRLYDNINKRFDKMVKNGALEEVFNLINISKKQELPKAIGIKQILDYYNGNISLDCAIEISKQESRNYAKRQLTWFRKRFSDFEKIFV